MTAATPPADPAETEDDAVVRYAVVGELARITLHRPEYGNAQNSAMTYALDAALRRAVDDDAVKAIVLDGAGRHFCAGHDIGSPGRDVDDSFPRVASPWYDHVERTGPERIFAREQEVYVGMCRRWRELPKPTIAMVHGACIAGGLMLAWSCDLIVASDDAFFSDPVVRMGIPGVELFAHPWVMGPRIAKEFLFTGQRMPATRAYEVGMINRVVPRDQLEATTVALAEEIARMPRFGLALAKKAVNQAEDLMGFQAGQDSAFGLHQLGHAHSAATSADHLGGQTPGSIKNLFQNDRPPVAAADASQDHHPNPQSGNQPGSRASGGALLGHQPPQTTTDSETDSAAAAKTSDDGAR